jgi:hypothetical protein
MVTGTLGVGERDVKAIWHGFPKVASRPQPSFVASFVVSLVDKARDKARDKDARRSVLYLNGMVYGSLWPHPRVPPLNTPQMGRGADASARKDAKLRGTVLRVLPPRTSEAADTSARVSRARILSASSPQRLPIAATRAGLPRCSTRLLPAEDWSRVRYARQHRRSWRRFRGHGGADCPLPRAYGRGAPGRRS